MLTFVMLRWDGSVCRLSVKRVGLYDEKTAPVSASTHVPNVLLLFVLRNSRKRGPYMSDRLCRPVLTQLLVPKTTVKNLQHFRVRQPPRPRFRKPMTKSKSPPMLLGYASQTEVTNTKKISC